MPRHTPLSLEIPISFGNVRISFFVYENLFFAGALCASIPHSHSEYELLYTVRGDGRQTVDGKDVICRAGDLLLLRPDTYHYQSAEKISEDVERCSFRFFLRPPAPSAAPNEQKGYHALRDALDRIFLLRDGEGKLYDCFSRLHRELSERRLGYFECVRATCTLLLTELLRLAEADGDGIFPSEELRHATYFRNRIEGFLRWRYAEKVGIEELAEALHLSTRQTARLLHRYWGMSFVHKLTEVRLAQARVLLTETQTPLIKVATACGFQSYSYFCTCFRRATALSPGAYRTAYGTSADKPPLS